jgi:hypothetical protein
MPKLALKFFLAKSALHRKHRRPDWDRAIAILGTLVTTGLILLYLSQRGIID